MNSRVAENFFSRLCLTLALAGLFLAGCSLFPQLQVAANPTATLPAAVTDTTEEASPEGAPLPTVNTPPAVVTLVVWLPPQFDPEADSPSGRLLYDRLQSFLNEHADVRLEVRLKALDGTGGLLDALSTASAAAPRALPDLVALPRPLLESAALKGLLRPFDDLTDVQAGVDWYPYARSLARLQDSTFGLPFAGEALLLVSYPEVALEPPVTWGETTAISGTLAFPAADPQALFPLSLYLAAGGKIQDAQGRPTLDEAKLLQVLQFFAQAEAAGNLPYWVVQFESAEQVWQAFEQRQAQQALAWSTRYLAQPDAGLAGVRAGLLPAPDGSLFSLATGWVWALPATQPERQELSAQLAEYLVESAFLAEWSAAAGYLPTRPTALQAWPAGELRVLAGDLAARSQPYPPMDLMAALSPVLKQATLDVLSGLRTPEDAAQQARLVISSP